MKSREEWLQSMSSQIAQVDPGEEAFLVELASPELAHLGQMLRNGAAAAPADCYLCTRILDALKEAIEARRISVVHGVNGY